MKVIYEQTKTVKQILSKQVIDNNRKYRRFFYLSECPTEGGSLFLNTITYELLFLSNEEVFFLNSPDLNNPTVRYLVEQYFLVPIDFDDKKFGTQVTDTRFQIQNIYTNPPLSFFIILPTTGCNARCFYCFEQGAKISNMTEQTAHDVADFIERKGDKKVRIQWFGGEPLVNIKAIDIISQDLIEKNINFSSKMITNGYLLDEATIKKAVDLWKLDTLQITLDGTEDVYNKTKNYVYKDVSSPFKRVLNNIENALKAGIQVNIRLNTGEHNIEDLFELSRSLVKKFSKYNNCYIYVIRLFEDPCAEVTEIDIENRHKLIEQSIELQKFITDNMPKIEIKEIGKAITKPSTCVANSDNSVMIVPDGHLGKCEHFVDHDFFGSIYSDEIDLKKIMEYKNYRIKSPNCTNCELRNLCMPLKCCTGVSNHCDDFDKKAITARLNSKLLNIYSKFLEIENENL